MIKSISPPDFKALLVRLQSANSRKPSTIKRQSAIKSVDKKRSTVKSKTDKKKKDKTRDKTKKDHHADIKCMVKELGKVVSAKDLETKDVKRKIVELQAQAAVYNQDISILLANISMIESTSYASLTSSLTTGVDVVNKQCYHVSMLVDKCIDDANIVRQRDDDVRRCLDAEKAKLDDLQDKERKLIRDLGEAEDRLVVSNDNGCELEKKINKIEDEIQVLKINSVTTSTSNEQKHVEISQLKDTVSRHRQKATMIDEDSRRFDRLLAADHARMTQVTEDLRKNRRLVEELKKQIGEWSSQSKGMWRRSDDLIDAGNMLTGKVEKLRTEVEHFNRDLEHYGSLVSSTSKQIEDMRHSIAQKEPKVEKLKAYAQDLQDMQARSLQEVKVMRRTICS